MNAQEWIEVIVLVVCFVAAALASAKLSSYNRLTGRGGAPLPIAGLGDRPILHLELPRSEDDLRAVLSRGDRAKNLRDARAGNRIDSLFFVPAYTALLVVVGLLLQRGAVPRVNALLMIAVLIVPVVAACDWAENAGITRTLDHFEQGGGPQPGDAARIAYPSLAKWWLLTLVLLIDGVAGVIAGPLWRRGLSVLLLIAGGGLAFIIARYAVG